MRYYIVIFTLLVFASACRNEEKTEVFLFRKVPSDESGLQFSNSLSNRKLDIISYMYYYNGGGVAAGDFNNDGLTDLYFTSNEESNKLFLNKGDFKFEDITAAAGVQGTGDWSTGVTLVDINNDGYLDIYVCQVSNFKGLQGKNLLFVNNRDLTFTERAADYGLDFSGLSTQAVFFDYDNDGDLDMYLLNHSVHGVHSYGSSELRNQVSEFAGDRLFNNKSELGIQKFEDVTHSSGIFSSHIGYGLGVAVSDVNMDGFPDLYIANDFHENDYLYVNNGDGTFSESLEKFVAHTSRYSMGCDIADVDGDAWPDIVTLDMLPEDPEILLKSASEDSQEVSDIKASYGYAPQYVRNCLQINRKDHFVEVAQYAGIHATDWSWSTLIADFDNDSNAEIFITNGIYKRPNDLDYIQYMAETARLRNKAFNQDSLDQEMMKRLPTLRIANYMFKNTGALRFANMSKTWGLDAPSNSNGVIYADLDNDGDLDLVINNVNQEAFLYENQTNQQHSNTFLQIELRSPVNHFGIGAKVLVYAGERIFAREMVLTRGFQSSVEPVIHVGLGSVTSIDSIEVFWRGKKYQVEKAIGVNTRVIITEQEEKKARDYILPTDTEFQIRKADVTIPYTYPEKASFRDYYNEPLLPYSLASEGPPIAVADVNGDGMDDVFIGGANGQPAVLLLQTKQGKFIHSVSAAFSDDRFYEDSDAVFVDVNNDQHPDLYVVSGGGQFPEGHPLLADRLYINDGKGNFTRNESSLPRISQNGSCVRAADVNGDGFIDLFVGSRSVPGFYGLTPSSYLLMNTGNGTYIIQQEMKIGMVTDAEWFDYNLDGSPDLVVVGDWMPVTIYENRDAILTQKEIAGIHNVFGWWRSVTVRDLNQDGLPDLLVGNIGNNIKLQASANKPVWLYVYDFDDNGQTDPVIFYPVGSRTIPFQSKTQLGKQMPFLNKKFLNHNAFAEIREPHDLFPSDKLSKALMRNATSFSSGIFMNKGNDLYVSLELPPEVQYSSVRDFYVDDFNRDGVLDIVLVGNNFNHSVNLGNAAGQSILLLRGDKEGGYSPVLLTNQYNFNHSYQSVHAITVGKKPYLLFVRNANAPELVSVESVKTIF
jgi:enediyne biosynthesis protein E4